MSGNINTELNTARVAETTPGISSISSQSASQKQNTVFEGNLTTATKKRVLTPEEYNLLKAKGYTPENMDETQINKALVDIHIEEANKKAAENLSTPTTETSSQAPSPAPTTEGEASVSTQPVQEETTSSSASTLNSIVQTNTSSTTTTTAAVQSSSAPATESSTSAQTVSPAPVAESDSTQNSNSAQQTTAQNQTVEVTNEELKLDFNDEKTRCFAMDPKETGLYQDDIAERPEEAVKIFTAELAKSQIGKEKWDVLTSEQQAEAVKNIEQQLEEKVPSWKNLTAKGKAEIVEAYTFGSVANLRKLEADASFAKKPLDVQLEIIAKKIVEKNKIDQKNEKFINNFHSDLEKFVSDNPKYSKTPLKDLNASGEINNAMFDCLKAKLAKNNGDTSCFNEYEHKLYDTFAAGEKMLGKGNLKCWGKYDLSGNFDAALANRDDIALAVGNYAKGSDEYKKALSNLLIEEPDTAESTFKQLLNAGNAFEKGMMMEIYAQLPESVRNKINLNLPQATHNVSVAVSTGNDEVTATALEDARQVAAQEVKRGNDLGQTVLDNSNENINDLIKDKDIAAQSVIDGLRHGGEAGYQRGVKSGKISAPQVDKIDAVILDEKNNDLYSDGVIRAGTATIGFGTEKNRRILIDLATSNTKAMMGVAENYHTYGKEHETYTLKELQRNAENKLNKNEAINVLNRAADNIENASVENQAELHSIVSNGKYSEVQEHAASNIYKYHESVQAEALDITKNTGNSKAIDNAMANYDKYSESVQQNPKYQSMQKETETRQAQEVAKQVADFHAEYEKLTGMKSNIDNEISDKEQKITYVKEFLNASPQEQFKMLSKIPMSWQGAVFSKIAQYCPQMLTSMVKQGYGKHILNTPGLSSDVIYKVINIMLTSQDSDKKSAVKYVKSHKSMFSAETLDRISEFVLSNSSSKAKKYALVPDASTVKGALFPKKGAVYENQEEMFYNA